MRSPGDLIIVYKCVIDRFPVSLLNLFFIIFRRYGYKKTQT
jgi:hypothetical protein